MPPFQRPALELAEIVRRHGNRLAHLSGDEMRILRAIVSCRTAALGGHVETCDHCHYQRIAYNSCRNRHCPKCQALRQEKWITARTERLLSTRHFHVVFTLPSELRPLGKHYPHELFGALFAAASETLLELGNLVDNASVLGRILNLFELLIKASVTTTITK